MESSRTGVPGGHNMQVAICCSPFAGQFSLQWCDDTQACCQRSLKLMEVIDADGGLKGLESDLLVTGLSRASMPPALQSTSNSSTQCHL